MLLFYADVVTFR